MTPGARVAAAIEVLDSVQTGTPAEQALTRWARQSRFAGSKDRAAVRDHVFDVLRRRRSAAVYGGGQTGRALMIGALRQEEADLTPLFSGEGHAPAPLTDHEIAQGTAPTETGDRWNLPDWILPEFQRSLGEEADATAFELQNRAPITLRVNLQEMTRDAALAALQGEGVATHPNPLSETALTVTDGARRLRNSQTYQGGGVELQDAASQAVIDLLPPASRCLDYCAGGGGKALAMAAKGLDVSAHDIAPRRMQNLPARARRAGVEIEQYNTAELAGQVGFDLVLCDAPCSGSGAWRRSPEGKWTLTRDRLDALNGTQDDILDQALPLVATGGTLVYATCSVLRCENEDRIAAFLERHTGWQCRLQRRFNVMQHGDGFFTAHLTRVKL
ncbi:RsmB/NOP family class I SAM-dependent RNA methyltransferase [uncultured Roseobacter sp.]|uniref:RsmB/NOP family class I SAM-dependent RNA methyltransferase n=1 Tax=uncultured Roseobacter sp. TaxID=114847 RepID=UPI0026099F8D|nr:RsmB/NOP family class I SAM-dependent RNA methyltransferase [uncultured Roseobacter sp.]